jgi:hypothetical protein
MGIRIQVGDVFEIPLGDGMKCYMQYVGKDATQLYSEVIRVFKKKYAESECIKVEDVVLGEISFYIHVLSVKSGVDTGLWNRVGNNKSLTGINPLFKSPNDIETKKIVERWHVWEINKPWKDVTSPSKLLEESFMGSIVFNCISVVEKIKTGSFSFHNPKYPGEK